MTLIQRWVIKQETISSSISCFLCIFVADPVPPSSFHISLIIQKLGCRKKLGQLLTKCYSLIRRSSGHWLFVCHCNCINHRNPVVLMQIRPNSINHLQSIRFRYKKDQVTNKSGLMVEWYLSSTSVFDMYFSYVRISDVMMSSLQIYFRRSYVYFYQTQLLHYSPSLLLAKPMHPQTLDTLFCVCTLAQSCFPNNQMVWG